MTFKWKNSGGSTTAALSASIVTGGSVALDDFLLVMIDQGGGVVTPPAGWTLIGAPNNGSNAVVFWKIAGASEPSSYTFSWTSSGQYDWAIASWSGILGTPIDRSAQSQGSSAGPYVAPSVTPVGNADLLLCLWDVEHVGTYTPPAGMTTRLSVVTPGTTYFGISELQLASNAATGTKTTTVTGGGSVAFWSTTIALNISGAVQSATPFVPKMRQYLRAGVTQAPPGIPVVSPASFTVAANPTLDEFVGTISATNSPTSFAITAGDPNQNFAVYSTGNLRTAATGTPPAAGNYSLSITATNAAGTSVPATISVTVSSAQSGTRPGPTNTGYRNAPGYPGSLTTGPSTIQSGATYSFMLFSGGTFIGSVANPVSNVTFLGCRFVATGDINIALFGDNITFNYCSLEPAAVSTPPVAYNQGYQYGIEADGSYNAFVQQLTVQNCDIWGFGNGIDVAGSTQAKPQVYRNNWIHDPRADGGIDHTDALGNMNAANSSYVVIDNNVIEGIGNTNALAIQGGTHSNFTITNNLFGGYGYTLSMYDTVSNITFTDNVFSTRINCVFGPMRENWPGYPGLVWRRNKWMVPAGAAWGTPSNDGKFWMPVAGARGAGADNPFVSTTDYTG